MQIDEMPKNEKSSNFTLDVCDLFVLNLKHNAFQELKIYIIGALVRKGENMGILAMSITSLKIRHPLRFLWFIRVSHLHLKQLLHHRPGHLRLHGPLLTPPNHLPHKPHNLAFLALVPDRRHHLRVLIHDRLRERLVLLLR
jgi:hypothetical protein